MCESSVEKGGKSDLIKGKGKREKAKGQLLLRDARHNAEHVMQLDLITGFEVFRDRFRPNPGEADLSLRIVRIEEVHIER
jgi:hypothetical protein